MTKPERPEWDDRPDDHYSFILPFVAVVSVGGRYDDLGFASGYQMGIIYGLLSDRRVVATTQLIYRDLVDQVDLIAMRHGYSSEVLNQDDEWVQIGFTREEI